MKKVLTSLVLVVLAVAVAYPLAAADKEKKKKKGAKGRGPAAALIKRVKAAGVEGETLEKVEALAKEYAPKIVAANSKIDAATRKKIAEARKAAAADGKKGKDLATAVAAAVQLTDEQKAGQKEAQKLQRELIGKVAALLTPEQREKAKLRVGKGNAKKKKKKKDAA